MSLKILFILTLTLFHYKNSSAQDSFPKQLVGTWINLEYERALSIDSLNEKMKALISPRFLYLDSLGNCRISTRFEHIPKVAKPIGSRKFGNTFQFSYKINEINFTINEIEGKNNFLSVNFDGFLIGMIFKKYNKN